MRTLAATAVLLLLTSGCFAPTQGPDEEPQRWQPQVGYSDPGFAGAIPVEGVDGHDHRDPAQHRLAHNATLLSSLDLREFGWSEESVVGAHALAVHGELVAVAVNGGDPGTGQHGFHIIDASDPADLRHVSFWDAGVDVNGDRTIAWSPDGNTIFLGFEDGTRPGIAAVDVSDPTAPTEVAFWTDDSGFGPHTVAAGEIDGQTYIFALVAGVAILRFDGDGMTLVGRYVTQDELAVRDALQHVDPSDPQNTYFSTYALRSVYAHDTNFYTDPATGKPLLLVAYAYDGMKILDLTIPSAPVLHGRFLPPADSSHKHYTHSVTAERLEDGRLIVVVGSETFEAENQRIASPIWILDATETLAGRPLQTAPTHVSTWRNPSDAPAGALGLSVHFFRQQEGFLYLSHYHGGVWGLDIRTEADRAAPAAFAFIMPVPAGAIAPPEECCLNFDLDGVPMVFDVDVTPNGTVVAADLIQGVSAIRLELPA